MGHGEQAGGPAHDRIDTKRAHSARIYDYVIGGKDHYQVDVDAGEAMMKGWPSLRVSMRQNRLFMQRAARHLAREAGVRQFLDIGTGLPTSPNLHEVVQREQPDASVVYVDNDPIVLAHAEALLTSAPPGRTAYLDADMREPESILESPVFRELLDLEQPVALTVFAILHFIRPPADHELLRRLLDPLPSGSFLAVSTATDVYAPAEIGRVKEQYESRGIPMVTRTEAEVGAFFDGLELVEPGLTQVHRWRPTEEQAGVADEQVAMLGAVARKP
ncbi:SAM-dependent methyltransferase [Streptomyces sp. NPDC048057]|uniref:SAM-dependent methyltransferase n=1 Tax=Streptomyces sp. NPDC048057 TaxID=3155628 RepID=UPI0033F3C2D5